MDWLMLAKIFDSGGDGENFEQLVSGVPKLPVNRNSFARGPFASRPIDFGSIQLRLSSKRKKKEF